MWPFKKKTKGCLYYKTKQQKIDFFESLFSFAQKDFMFFKEQYDDLLPNEKVQFRTWLSNEAHSIQLDITLNHKLNEQPQKRNKRL